MKGKGLNFDYYVAKCAKKAKKGRGWQTAPKVMTTVFERENRALAVSDFVVEERKKFYTLLLLMSV